jgi:hypothetical protein
MPQRIPGSRSFTDVAPHDPALPYIESVAGSRARTVLIDDMGSRTFRPQLAARRIDVAVALVRAAGLAAEAQARAGEPLGLTDENRVPDRLKGYVAVALERGLLAPLPDGAGDRFDPTGKLTRLEASARLLTLLDLLAAEPSAAQGSFAPVRHRGAKDGERASRPELHRSGR